MDHTTVHVPVYGEGETPPPVPVRKLPLRHRLDRRQRLAVAAGVVVAFALLWFGADRLTSSPAVCGSCHEMGARVAEWKTSPHAKVACVSCHVPHPWYALPQAVFDRTRFLSRVLGQHVGSAGSVAMVDSRPAGIPPMSDAVCKQCHDPNRKPTTGLGIIIDHPKHAKRNGSCVSCHITVAHPSPEWGTAVSFMQVCFNCHGTGKTAKAPATCGLCHPAGFKLRPGTHDAKWKQTHGKVALTERKQCLMCHQASFCDGCHKIQMPHPAGWAQKSGHPVAAQRDRQVCVQCHGGAADFCTMCHHKAYDPARGTWVQQHFLEVEAKGASYCLESCHSPVFCATCHVRNL